MIVNFVVWLKVFVVACDDSFVLPLAHVMGQKIFVTKSVASYCNVYSYI